LKTIDLSLVRVRALATNAVRITHASPADDDWPPDPPWLDAVLIAPARLRPEDAALVVDSSDADFVQVQTRAGEAVLAEFGRARQSPAGNVSLTLLTSPEEDFYTWGEWFKSQEHADQRLHLRASEPPSLDQKTQPPVPCLISSRGYGFFLLNRHTSDWRMDRERCVIEIKLKPVRSCQLPVGLRPDRFLHYKTKGRPLGAAFCSRRSSLPKNGG